MRKWNLPLTYAPKIQAVQDGTCRQTIHIVGKAGRKDIGDLVSFHGYKNGRGTPWTWRTPYTPFTEVINITILEKGIIATFTNKDVGDTSEEYYVRCTLWLWSEIDFLAAKDNIVPPTGEALRDVLFSKNKIPKGGFEAQVLRW